MVTGEPGRGPISAAELAAQLGNRLPGPAAVPAPSFTLVERVRDLVEAVVTTDVTAEVRAEAAAEIAMVTERLRARRRNEAVFLVRHPDGRVESLLQAGSGRLNPQAPPVQWVERPAEPGAGTSPRPVEVKARCTFNASHGGSPGRVYGGVVALVLDEVLGVAATAAGATGMTVSLTVTLKAATPLGVPVEITGRYTHSEGRKSYATGEVRVGDVVTAEAAAVFVAPGTARQPPRLRRPRQP